jgi:hypothetical protein
MDSLQFVRHVPITAYKLDVTGESGYPSRTHLVSAVVISPGLYIVPTEIFKSSYKMTAIF